MAQVLTRQPFLFDSIPLQLKGLGTNLATYFDLIDYYDSGYYGRQDYNGTRDRVIHYLVDVFSCLADQDGIRNEDGFALTGIQTV